MRLRAAAMVPQTVDYLGRARYPGDVAVVRWGATDPTARAPRPWRPRPLCEVT